MHNKNKGMENIKVYGIDTTKRDRTKQWSPPFLGNNEFIEEAEKQGLVWSLKGFQDAFNKGEINSEYIYIRFIEN